MAKSETLSVLLADDDQGLRDTLAEVLDREGFHVFPASSGLEALEISRTERVDLGVFDMHMPDITGIELFCRITELHSIPLPTILMTSDSSEDIDIQVVRVGIYRLVRKPLQVDPLTRALHELVDLFF